METVLKVRRLCLVDGRSISEVARKFQLSRNTVRKYLRDGSEPSYHQSKPPHRPQLGPFCQQLEKWLEQDLKRPRKERRTAQRLFECLQDVGYKGAYDSVRRFVKAFKDQKPQSSNAFVPLDFAPGEAYQFDWSHETVELGGVVQKIKVAHFRMCHSRKSFLIAYPRESLEMVLDAHVKALDFFGGVPRKVIIDNPKTMVSTIGKGKEREFNIRFLSMLNHYLLEPVACTPAAGWEKGQVENQVGKVRQWLFTPRLKFDDLSSLNQWLELQCHRMGERKHPIFKDQTLNEVFAQELAHCRPAMTAFDGYNEKIVKVSSSCLVTYDRNRYSVPAAYANKPVKLHVYADQIKIIADEQLVAQHSRSFGRDQSLFDAWHYLPVLQKKPGALRNGAPFKQWELPKALHKIKERYLKQTGGDREFVELLLMVQRYDLESVTVACELALEQGCTRLSAVLNILHRLNDPGGPSDIETIKCPPLHSLPQANCERYDSLFKGGSYAEHS